MLIQDQEQLLQEETQLLQLQEMNLNQELLAQEEILR